MEKAPKGSADETGVRPDADEPRRPRRPDGRGASAGACRPGPASGQRRGAQSQFPERPRTRTRDENHRRRRHGGDAGRLAHGAGEPVGQADARPRPRPQAPRRRLGRGGRRASASPACRSNCRSPPRSCCARSPISPAPRARTCAIPRPPWPVSRFSRSMAARPAKMSRNPAISPFAACWRGRFRKPRAISPAAAWPTRRRRRWSS